MRGAPLSTALRPHNYGMGFAWFIIWCALTAVGLALLARLLLLPLVRLKVLLHTTSSLSAACVLHKRATGRQCSVVCHSEVQRS
jgi:hypothetical protein